MEFNKNSVDVTMDELRVLLDIMKRIVEQDCDAIRLQLPPDSYGFAPKLEISIILPEGYNE